MVFLNRKESDADAHQHHSRNYLGVMSIAAMDAIAMRMENSQRRLPIDGEDCNSLSDISRSSTSVRSRRRPGDVNRSSNRSGRNFHDRPSPSQQRLGHPSSQPRMVVDKDLTKFPYGSQRDISSDLSLQPSMPFQQNESTRYRGRLPLDDQEPMSVHTESSSSGSVSIPPADGIRCPPVLSSDEISQDRKSILNKIRRFKLKRQNSYGSGVGDGNTTINDDATTICDDATTVFGRGSVTTEGEGSRASTALTGFLMKAAWWQKRGKNDGSDCGTIASGSTGSSSSFEPRMPMIRNALSPSVTARPDPRGKPFLTLDGGGVYYPKQLFGGGGGATEDFTAVWS